MGGPIMASTFIEKFGSESENENFTYIYRDQVKIPPLTMLDDILSIVECSYKSNNMIGYLNAQARLNSLMFNTKKCFKIHVGQSKERHKCGDLWLDNWDFKEIDSSQTGQLDRKEIYRGKSKIKEVNNERYLGDYISNDGSNAETVRQRCIRSISIRSKINSMLEEMVFGKHYHKVGLNLIESLLLNSILVNTSVWYNVTENDYRKLEQCHEKALRNLLGTGLKTPLVALYILTGSIPIRFRIMQRQLYYLHHILTQNKNSMLSRFFYAQYETRKKKDWATTVLNHLKKLKIKMSFDEISLISEGNFKKIVRKETEKCAFEYLNKKKSKTKTKKNCV